MLHIYLLPLHSWLEVLGLIRIQTTDYIKVPNGSKFYILAPNMSKY